MRIDINSQAWGYLFLLSPKFSRLWNYVIVPSSTRNYVNIVYTPWASELIHLPLVAQLSLRFCAVWDLLTGRESLDDFLHSHGWLPTSQGCQTKHSMVGSVYRYSSPESRGGSYEILREAPAHCKQESPHCPLAAPKRWRLYPLCTVAWMVKGWGRNWYLEGTACSFLFTCVFSSEESSQRSTIQSVT